ncbi:MAG: homocysteine S-methyltransferase family protein [Clostridia bacterium]|nr:homocysteine S-methyltransferase family protein [Clostridia bacterium]
MKFPLILDGATGTNLTLRGLPAGVCPEEWILQNPEALTELQRSFVAAGSNAVYAPTFGANREKLSRYGLQDRVVEFNHRLVELSRKAVGPDIMVGGDMTALGMFTVPMGDATFEDIYAIYHEQAAALEEAGVDFFVIETLMSLSEARAALLAVKAVSSKPVFVTLTVEANGKCLDGTDPAAAGAVLAALGADAFGLNCSAGPDRLREVLAEAAPSIPLPLIAKPNAGLPEVVDGKTFFRLSPADFARDTAAMAEIGVCIFGGCCGTTPDHIAALHDALRDVTPQVHSPETQALPADARHIFSPVAPDLSFDFQEIDEDLSELLYDLEEEDVLALHLQNEEDPALLEESLYLLKNPLALTAQDPALLERALRAYAGRAMIAFDGDSLPFITRYGAIPITL